MGERILLVEGKDDVHVMSNLFMVRKVPKTFEIACPDDEDEAGGVEKLLDSIRARLRAVDLECLAVVLDADDREAGRRWQSVRDRLVSAGHQDIPKEHAAEGTVFDISLRPKTPRSIRFGAWIMPNNQSAGMLEDFVADLICEDDPMLPHVDGFLDSIPEEQRRFTSAHQPKARIHSWLAVSERPGRPMGQAIQCDSRLDANHPSVEPFLQWIHKTLVH